METCSKCGAEAPSGTLARDTVDAAQIYCEKCRPKEKKARKPRKRKEEIPMSQAALRIEQPTIEELARAFNAMPKPALDLERLRLNAKKWAEESGLKNVAVSEATRENYNRYGYGFIFSVRGLTRDGKERMATARYTYTGERSFWSMDGMVTG